MAVSANVISVPWDRIPKSQFPDHRATICRQGFSMKGNLVQFNVSLLSQGEFTSEGKIYNGYQECRLTNIRAELKALRELKTKGLHEADAAFKKFTHITHAIGSSLITLYADHYNKYMAASKLIYFVERLKPLGMPALKGSYPYAPQYGSDKSFEGDYIVKYKGATDGIKVHKGVLRESSAKLAGIIDGSTGKEIEFSESKEVVELFLEFIYKGKLQVENTDLFPELYTQVT